MILKKENVDGKVVYVTVEFDEAVDCYKKGISLVFDDEDEKEEFYDKMEELEEEEEEAEEQKEEEKKEKIFTTDDLKDLGNMIKEKVNQFTGKVKELSKRDFKAYNEKTAKLVKILPYMEDQDIHELILEMLNEEGSLKDVDIRAIFPYLDSDDCDAIFLKALEEDNFEFKLKDIAPYVSEECLSKVVDLYLEGKIEDKEIEKLYPYLSSEDIRRIFKHMMKNE